MGIEKIRSACRSLERLGTWFGFGLPLLGLVSASERVLNLRIIAIRATDSTPWISASLASTRVLTAYSLCGLAAFILSRALAASITAYFEHLSRSSQDDGVQMDRAVIAIERLVGALESGNHQVAPGAASTAARASSVAEIEGAIRSSLWDQAAQLLDDLDAQFPDDSIIGGLREKLANAKRKASRDQLAQLEAAREVNDSDRVLEIYQALAPSLEFDERSSIDRELGKWFLTLIHRRLRTGTIQSDVVQLAARVAEVFATTVEGASLRAALPTLRRSVGLCPRCSQPYAGLAEACPKCLNGGAI